MLPYNALEVGKTVNKCDLSLKNILKIKISEDLSTAIIIKYTLKTRGLIPIFTKLSRCLYQLTQLCASNTEFISHYEDIVWREKKVLREYSKRRQNTECLCASLRGSEE